MLSWKLCRRYATASRDGASLVAILGAVRRRTKLEFDVLDRSPPRVAEAYGSRSHFKPILKDAVRGVR